MNAKQKIVADRMLSRLKRMYNNTHFSSYMDSESIKTAEDLLEACESSPEELIECAEGVYAPSTIYRMKSEYDGDTTYRIWCAIEDYIWNEWNKWKSNNK